MKENVLCNCGVIEDELHLILEFLKYENHRARYRMICLVFD